jgi:cytochrome c-type biogenesis protein CcmH/NrfF
MAGHVFVPVKAAANQEQPVTREQVLDVAKELVTPGGCPSLTLAECTLPTAFKIREEIAQMLAQGMEKEEIIDALVAKYGKAILGAPERTGWGLVIWYLPYTLMGLVAVLLGFWLFRKARPITVSEKTPPQENDAEEKDIQEILKKYL